MVYSGSETYSFSGWSPKTKWTTLQSQIVPLNSIFNSGIK